MRRLLTASLLAAVLSSFAAQQPEPPNKSAAKQESAPAQAPVAIPAGAIGLGAKIAEAAHGDFLKWARGYAKREILGRPAPPEDAAVQRTFDERFPKATPSARAAGIFLLWYEAYQQASENQQVFGQKMAELDRDIRNLENELRQIRNMSVPLPQARGARNAEARAEQHLEDALRQRDFYRRGLDAVGARLDICLKRLGALYETVKDSDPAEIRGLK